MKLIVSLFIAGLLSFGTIANIAAQQNIAYVDADETIKSMNEYRVIRGELELYQKQLLQSLEDEKKAIAKYYTSIIEKVKLGQLTPKEQQEAEAKLQKKQAVLRKKTEEADQKIAAKEKELSKPMYDKFEAAIQRLGKSKGYTYILDKRFLQFADKKRDVTNQLKKELGIKG